jgi:hypothetical protein
VNPYAALAPKINPLSVVNPHMGQIPVLIPPIYPDGYNRPRQWGNEKLRPKFRDYTFPGTAETAVANSKFPRMEMRLSFYGFPLPYPMKTLGVKDEFKPFARNIVIKGLDKFPLKTIQLVAIAYEVVISKSNDTLVTKKDLINTMIREGIVTSDQRTILEQIKVRYNYLFTDETESTTLYAAPPPGYIPPHMLRNLEK